MNEQEEVYISAGMAVTKYKMSPFLLALQAPDCIRQIASYQDGLYLDFRQFKRFNYEELMGSRYHANKMMNWLQQVREKLSPWYEEFGYERVTNLIQLLPDMYQLVQIDAVYSNDLAHARVIHNITKLTASKNRLINLASGLGHLQMVEFLHSIGHSGCNSGAMNLAARNGHFEVVKFLHEFRTEGCNHRAINGAAENGYLEIIQWLHKNRSEVNLSSALDVAREHSQNDVAEWIQQHLKDGCSPLTCFQPIG